MVFCKKKIFLLLEIQKIHFFCFFYNMEDVKKQKLKTQQISSSPINNNKKNILQWICNSTKSLRSTQFQNTGKVPWQHQHQHDNTYPLQKRIVWNFFSFFLYSFVCKHRELLPKQRCLLWTKQLLAIMQPSSILNSPMGLFHQHWVLDKSD